MELMRKHLYLNECSSGWITHSGGLLSCLSDSIMDMARSNLLSTSNDLFRSTAEKHSRGMARASAPKTQLRSYPSIVLTPILLENREPDTRSTSDINN